MSNSVQTHAASFIENAERAFFAHVSDHIPNHLVGTMLNNIGATIREMTSHHADLGLNLSTHISGGQHVEHVHAQHHGGRTHQEVALG